MKSTDLFTSIKIAALRQYIGYIVSLATTKEGLTARRYVIIDEVIPTNGGSIKIRGWCDVFNTSTLKLRDIHEIARWEKEYGVNIRIYP